MEGGRGKERRKEKNRACVTTRSRTIRTSGRRHVHVSSQERSATIATAGRRRTAPSSRDELRERAGPLVAFCRLFGLGLPLGDRGRRGRRAAADAALLAVNAALCAYGFVHVTSVARERMPTIWDVSTVMSVAKVYTYLLSPAVTVAAWQWHGPAVARAARAVLRASGGRAALRPYARRAAAWYALSVLAESAGYTLYHVGTAFAHFAPHEYAMIAVYNVWTVAPVHAYVALVDAARLAVRRVNGRAADGPWRARRAPWRRLSRTAVRLAGREFGLVIVAFVVRTIAEVVFFAFSVFSATYRSPRHRALRAAIYAADALFGTARMFEVFRVTHECRHEILRTQKILSSRPRKTKADHNQFRYFSLHTLHMDLNFMPCGIFEISYRNFVTIATLVTAFTVFQIQMKLH